MIERRRFLTRMIALGLLLRSPQTLSIELRETVAADPLGNGQDPWQTLGAILAHMLPHSDAAPGADDVHALDYLRATLEHPSADTAWKARIVDGAHRVAMLSHEKHGQAFTQIDGAQREALLRQIESEPGGSRWLSKLLDFLIEGLLADPIYGGNTEQAGWRWLRHQPGFPRPPADKRWYLLRPPVTRRSKAT